MNNILVSNFQIFIVKYCCWILHTLWTHEIKSLFFLKIKVIEITGLSYV